MCFGGGGGGGLGGREEEGGERERKRERERLLYDAPNQSSVAYQFRVDSLAVGGDCYQSDGEAFIDLRLIVR